MNKLKKKKTYITKAFPKFQQLSLIKIEEKNRTKPHKSKKIYLQKLKKSIIKATH